ncbi:hypothetical protein NOC27_908 [Nitrosococcus oceani AFC27]|nr:hypothetical protein NOC27_908 [Nitrosococcus oceani AFC27]
MILGELQPSSKLMPYYKYALREKTFPVARLNAIPHSLRY